MWNSSHCASVSVYTNRQGTWPWDSLSELGQTINCSLSSTTGWCSYRSQLFLSSADLELIFYFPCWTFMTPLSYPFTLVIIWRKSLSDVCLGKGAFRSSTAPRLSETVLVLTFQSVECDTWKRHLFHVCELCHLLFYKIDTELSRALQVQTNSTTLHFTVDLVVQ